MEKDIEKWMKDKIKNQGGLFMKWVSPGNDGVPDRIAIMPGGAIYFVELKTDKGNTKKTQDWQIERLKKLGCDVRVVKGMAEAERFIEEVVLNGVHSTRLSEAGNR